MYNNFILNLALKLIFLITISGVAQTKNKEILGFVNFCSELELKHINDRCGELGGDEEIIKIYKKDCEGELFADYEKHESTCLEKTTLLIKKVGLKFSEIDKLLVKKSIQQLIDFKLSNNVKIAHGGIINSVKSKDSTLMISDYPSKKWIQFNELKEHLLKGN